MNLTPILVTGVILLALSVYFFMLGFDDDSKLNFVFVFIGGSMAVVTILVLVLEQVIVYNLGRDKRGTVWMVELLLISIISAILLWA